MSKVEEFREAINANEDWQEEVRNFGAEDSVVTFANDKGYEFTEDEYSEYMENNISGELSLFETEMVSGGRSRISCACWVAREVYGANGVTYTDEALQKAKALEADPQAGELGTCMVKTHLSLSHDPDLKGRPTGWELPIRDILAYKGAGFIVPVAGAIKLMPGKSYKVLLRASGGLTVVPEDIPADAAARTTGGTL